MIGTIHIFELTKGIKLVENQVDRALYCKKWLS